MFLTLLGLFQAGTPSVAGMLVQAGMAILVPLAGAWGATALTKANAKVALWPDWEKRLLVTVYSIVLAGVSHALGLKLPDAWGALASTDIQAILAASGAMLFHRLLNPLTPTAARR